MTVAVTGASGQLGRRATELLLERLDPSEIVAITRRPEALDDLAGRGVELRYGDFDDPASLAAAFDGVERLLLISAEEIGRRVGQHRAAIDAAVAAGVRHVAYTSVANPSEANPAAVVPDHRATEQALRDSGVAWTFLRNNLYAEHQVASAQAAVGAGRLVTNAGDGATAYVSRDDCAAAAAAVLAGGGHEGRAYEITGPEAVTAAGFAELAGELAGVELPVVSVGDEEYVAGLVAAGIPEPGARLAASFGTATREGWLATVTSAVEELTGRPPRALREVLSRELVAA
jgi:NAD(P)H dehydrogenase (quinone)